MLTLETWTELNPGVGYQCHHLCNFCIGTIKVVFRVGSGLLSIHTRIITIGRIMTSVKYFWSTEIAIFANQKFCLKVLNIRIWFVLINKEILIQTYPVSFNSTAGRYFSKWRLPEGQPPPTSERWRLTLPHLWGYPGFLKTNWPQRLNLKLLKATDLVFYTCRICHVWCNF